MLTIKTNGIKFAAQMRRLGKAQPKVIRNALNDTVRDIARNDLPRNIRRYFDAPTPFTQNAFYYERATSAGAGHWKAFVRFKYDRRSSRFLKRHYLEAHVFGGTREAKGVEKLIVARLARPGFPKQFYPTEHVPRDRYGNVTRGFWNRVLSDLQAQRDVGTTSNRTARSVKRNKRYKRERFFIPAPKHRLAPGVWMRRGRKVFPVLIGTKPQRYAKRLPLFEIEARAVRHRLPYYVRLGQKKVAARR